MCIAIYNPASSDPISRERLHTCHNNNKDAMGMMWIEDGKIAMHKQLTDFTSFWDKYLQVKSTLGTNIVLHFRIGTHGANTLANCHPFYISDEMAFCHNGIISQCASHNDKRKRSDTRIFRDQILKQLPRRWYKNPAIQALLEHYLRGDKAIFMHRNETVWLYGQGIWEDKSWFSNSSFRQVVVYNKRSSGYNLGWDDAWDSQNWYKHHRHPATGQKLTTNQNLPKLGPVSEGWIIDNTIYCDNCFPVNSVHDLNDVTFLAVDGVCHACDRPIIIDLNIVYDEL